MSSDKKGGAFRNRYLITATLEALAPFHVGSGGFKLIENLNAKEKDKKKLEANTVVTDHSKKPYLPGSSIRGVLRQWSKEQFGATDAWQNLFGSQDAEGKFEVWNAACISSVITASDPHLSGWDRERLTFVAKSVALDPATGTAAEHKLYNFELVPEGACFKAVFSAQNLDDDEAALVNATIHGFNDETNPIVLGSMTKRGFGRFLLRDLQVYRLDQSQIEIWKKQVADAKTAGYLSIESDVFKAALPPSPEMSLINTGKVLAENWEMTLETPMVVRSGGIFGWKNACLQNIPKPSKVRNKNMRFKWGAPKGGDLDEIGDLNFSVRLEGETAVPHYHLPSSSIRGAMREWAITNLLPQEQWDIEAYLKDLPEGQPVPPLMDGILRLFGFTVSAARKDITETYTRAGRLQITAGAFAAVAAEPAMDGTWDRSYANNFGPGNAQRHVKPRNPIDRITHAAKEGGLHNFLEFSVGQSMPVAIKVKEPTDFDYKILDSIKQEINSGMIRFGGLTGIGRGRVSITERILQEVQSHGA